MKLTFFVKYNQQYINQFDSNHGSIGTYSEYIEAIIADHFLMYSSYIKYLRRNHGVKVQLVIPNWEKLNRLWSEEQESLGSAREPKRDKVYIEQIRDFGPDVVYLNSNFEFYPSLLNLKKELRISAVAWISCPIPNGTKFDGLDQVFTLFPPYKDLFEKDGIPVFTTQAGYDPEMNQPNLEPKYDITFIGGIGGFHKKREEYLKFLIPKTGMKVWGYGYSSPNPIKRWIKHILNGFVYVKSFQGIAWGKDMFKIMQESKIAFNSHGELAGEHSVNMRLFEATGAGALLLTEETESLKQFFEPGKEVVTYTSKEDALEKIRYYLEHEEERKKIAKAGQDRTLRDYSYERLASDMFKELEKLVDSKHEELSE